MILYRDQLPPKTHGIPHDPIASPPAAWPSAAAQRAAARPGPRRPLDRSARLSYGDSTGEMANP